MFRLARGVLPTLHVECDKRIQVSANLAKRGGQLAVDQFGRLLDIACLRGRHDLRLDGQVLRPFLFEVIPVGFFFRRGNQHGVVLICLVEGVSRLLDVLLQGAFGPRINREDVP